MEGGTYRVPAGGHSYGLEPAVSPSAFLSWLDGWRHVPRALRRGTQLRWFRRKECGFEPAVSPSAFLSWLDGWRRIPTMVPAEGVRTRARCVPIRVSTRGDGRRP